MMKYIKKELLPVCAIIVFMASYIGSANAAQYFYYQRLEGLISAEESFPFYADSNGNPYLDIAIYTPESLIYDITEDSVNMSIDLGESILNTANISLAFTSSDTDLIETPSNSETGDIRTLTIEKGSSTTWQDVTLTVIASHPDTDDVYIDTDIVFSSNCTNPIDSSLAAVKKAADAVEDHIIACDTDGNYLIETARDLLHISSYQQDAGIGYDILHGDYKLLSDVEFDISWSIDRTYQNEAGEESPTQTATHPYLKSAAININSIDNNVDWDLDGVIDDKNTSGWSPIGMSAPSPDHFYGNFDGNGHTVKNMYVNSDTNRYGGFLGLPRKSGAVIKNLGIEDFFVSVEATTGSAFAGGLFGVCISTSVENSYTKDGVVIAEASGGNNHAIAGGLIGQQNGTGIYTRNSYANNVDVISISDYIANGGGLSGKSIGVRTSESYATGDVAVELSSTSYGFAGGLIGQRENSYLENSYATGNVKFSGEPGDSSSTGGLVGDGYGGLYNSYTTGLVSSSRETGWFGALQGKWWSDVYSSYALNDTNTMSLGLTPTADRCSDTFDDATVSGGCNPLDIQTNWSDTFWNLDGANMTPTLKNMPNF